MADKKMEISSIVMPMVNPDQAVEAWSQYENLKSKILDPKTDIQKIQGNDFKKKSYWRKVATFFNLTTEVLEERSEKLGSTYVWHFTVRATAPNGRFADGVGSCDAYEKASFVGGKYIDSKGAIAKPNSLHNIRATAQARATNRAISDLVGGGEVSAEEVERGGEK